MKKEKKDKDFLHKPTYPGGIRAIRKFIKENLCYPESARKEKIEGTVHLKYTINYTGKVTDVKVISGLEGGCNEEAIRLVKLLQFEVPKNRKMRVLFHKKIQIHFRLPPKPAPKKTDTPATGIHYQYVPKSAPSNDSTDQPGTGYSYTIEW